MATWMAGLALVCACKDNGSAPPNTSAGPTSATVSAPSFTRPPASATGAATAPTAAPTAMAGTTVTASAAPSSSVAPVSMPNVEVKNIGLHVGGGPNDAATKRPIKAAVKPHFDALKLCYAKAKDPANKVTFGVDILIPRDGGKAKISKPRTGLKGPGVKECLVSVFEGVTFVKPATKTAMMISFSVRFTKK